MKTKTAKWIVTISVFFVFPLLAAIALWIVLGSKTPPLFDEKIPLLLSQGSLAQIVFTVTRAYLLIICGLSVFLLGFGSFVPTPWGYADHNAPFNGILACIGMIGAAACLGGLYTVLRIALYCLHIWR